MSRINTVLISNSPSKNLTVNEIIGGSNADIEDMRFHCKALTGSTVMPSVLYKGRKIEAGELGDRRLGE